MSGCLTDILKREPLPERAVAYTSREILKGLAAMHRFFRMQ
jgi:serine/threonine protein kinase